MLPPIAGQASIACKYLRHCRVKARLVLLLWNFLCLYYFLSCLDLEITKQQWTSLGKRATRKSAKRKLEKRSNSVLPHPQHQPSLERSSSTHWCVVAKFLLTMSWPIAHQSCSYLSDLTPQDTSPRLQASGQTLHHLIATILGGIFVLHIKVDLVQKFFFCQVALAWLFDKRLGHLMYSSYSI